MKLRAALVVVFALLMGVTFGIEAGHAEDEPAGDQPDEPKPVDNDGDGKPDEKHEEAKPADKDGDGKPDEKHEEGKPADKDGDGKPDEKHEEAKPADKDGDGKPDEKHDDPKQDDKPVDKDGDGKPDHQAGDAADVVDKDGHDAVDNKDSDGDGIPDWKEDSDGDGISDADEKRDSDGDGIPDIEEVSQDEDGEADEDDPALKVMDADGDGVVDADEVADNKEFDRELKKLGIPKDVDEKRLAERAADPKTALKPSLTVAQFQELVKDARKVVLGKIEVKAERKAAKKMKVFAYIVFAVSGLGIFLLLMPLFLRKKYPGQGKVLFKYSALAALVFIVTVNLFGAVLYGFRTVQTLTAKQTNPTIAIAGGTFDVLHDNAEDYAVFGKELYGPSLREMRERPDEQPEDLLLKNGLKVVEDAKVFLSIYKMKKKINWVFSMIPVILIIVTLLLFVIAIKPTLVEIVKMPAQVASGTAGGSAGKDMMKKSMARVIGELKATVCTIGVLVVITLIAGFVLGKATRPAMAAFLEYFSTSVEYLRLVDGASSGMVFISLFGVILYLVFNVAVLILSTAFFLGKTQKIFQQRFNEGVPVSTHFRFFKWGVPSVLGIQIFPLLFAFAVAKILNAINDHSGVTDINEVSWNKIMLMGPLFLVGLFLVVFWAARGLAAIKFLATYKVKVKTPPGVQVQSQPVVDGADQPRKD
jgi:hypothetical protein